jgi:hypothetical protein
MWANIKLGVKEIRWEDVNCISLNQYKIRWDLGEHSNGISGFQEGWVCLEKLSNHSFPIRFCRIRNSVVCAVTGLPTGSTSGRARDLVAASKQALKTSNYPIYCARETEPDYSTMLGPRLRINGPIVRFSIVVTLRFQNRGVAPRIKNKTVPDISK